MASLIPRAPRARTVRPNAKCMKRKCVNRTVLARGALGISDAIHHVPVVHRRVRERLALRLAPVGVAGPQSQGRLGCCEARTPRSTRAAPPPPSRPRRRGQPPASYCLITLNHAACLTYVATACAATACARQFATACAREVALPLPAAARCGAATPYIAHGGC